MGKRRKPRRARAGDWRACGNRAFVALSGRWIMLSTGPLLAPPHPTSNSPTSEALLANYPSTSPGTFPCAFPLMFPFLSPLWPSPLCRHGGVASSTPPLWRAQRPAATRTTCTKPQRQWMLPQGPRAGQEGGMTRTTMTRRARGPRGTWRHCQLLTMMAFSMQSSTRTFMRSLPRSLQWGPRR